MLPGPRLPCDSDPPLICSISASELMDPVTALALWGKEVQDCGLECSIKMSGCNKVFRWSDKLLSKLLKQDAIDACCLQKWFDSSYNACYLLHPLWKWKWKHWDQLGIRNRARGPNWASILRSGFELAGWQQTRKTACRRISHTHTHTHTHTHRRCCTDPGKLRSHF